MHNNEEKGYIGVEAWFDSDYASDLQKEAMLRSVIAHMIKRPNYASVMQVEVRECDDVYFHHRDNVVMYFKHLVYAPQMNSIKNELLEHPNITNVYPLSWDS